MRGRTKHNWTAKCAEDLLREDGFRVEKEKRFATPVGQNFVDLWTEREGLRLALEVETSPRHAVDNLRKARFLQCDAYGILCPTGTSLTAVRRAMQGAIRELGVPTFLATLHTLRTEVARVFPRRIVRGRNGKKRDRP
jgi:hypothetical protein